MYHIHFNFFLNDTDIHKMQFLLFLFQCFELAENIAFYMLFNILI